jgi:hypothetical protein
METKLCVVCETEKDRKLFRNRVVKGALYVDNVCSACRSARERAQLKLELIEAFGGKCNCCGEAHPAFLTLEHIENVSHGKPGARACHQLIRDAKKDGWDKTKYELLCFNCNCAKAHLGQCPHRSGLTVEQELARLKQRAESRIGFNYRNTWGSQKGWFRKGFDGRRPNEKVLPNQTKVTNS